MTEFEKQEKFNRAERIANHWNYGVTINFIKQVYGSVPNNYGKLNYTPDSRTMAALRALSRVGLIKSPSNNIGEVRKTPVEKPMDCPEYLKHHNEKQ